MKYLRALYTIYKRVFYIMTDNQKKRVGPVFVSMLINSVLELIGVSAIYPLLTLMMNREDAGKNTYVRILFNLFPSVSYNEMIIIMCVLIMCVFIVKNAIALLCVYIQTYFSASCKREIQTTMFESYLRRHYDFFVNNNTGEIIRGVNGDTTAVYQILLDGFQILSETITIVLIGVYLFTTDWIIALVSLVLAAICFFIIVLGFKGKLKEAGKENLIVAARQFQFSSQAINGIKEIIVMNRRDYFVKQYDANSYKVQKISVFNSFIAACPDRILEGVFVSGFMIILALTTAFGNSNSLIPIVGAFAMGAIKILPSISKLTNRINDIVYQQKGLENCYNNIREARRLREEDKRFQEYSKNAVTEKQSMKNSIEINNIFWRYNSNSKIIFESMSLSIKKGESIAFIGASGAGKTTLADIILGIYKPQNGNVLMDGIDINDLGDRWNEMIGYVPQSAFLLDDTIRRNVAFGIPDEEIDDEWLWEVLDRAQMKEFVENLPLGLDTNVGDRGVKFSGGQRQRLSIARALFNNPDILVLDEATSALDAETEAAVMGAIDSLHGYKTLIIVAHRLSTVKGCDRIYEIGNGKAVEVDKHKLFGEC